MSSTHITTCLLCELLYRGTDRKPVTIKANEMPPFNPDKAPPASVLRYLNALREHIEKKHPKEYQYALLMGHTMTALQVMSHYETTDPGIIQSQDMTRALIHKMTRKNDVDETDLQIRYERAAEVESDLASYEQRMLAEFRDLRNLLLEEGEYAPTPEPAAVVTP